jgi:threonine/homoserine/homoserine lactone efflux protein
MPGASQAYMINQAVRYGWGRAALVSLAPLLADGPIILVAVLLLSLVPPWAMAVLQIVGAGFIFYLTYLAISRLLSKESDANAPRRSFSLLAAVTINLLNPVVYLYWTTVSGPILVQAWRVIPLLGLGFLLIFYGVMVITSNGLILLICGLKQLGSKVRLGLQIVSTAMLAIMGLIQLVAGISALL